MDATATPISSALSHMGRFRRRLRDKRAIVFLDYDGTLTPIMSRPELAQITSEMKALVSALAERCNVSIVSGRSRQKLKELLGLENVIYAGSHGIDIAGPRTPALDSIQDGITRTAWQLFTAISQIASREFPGCWWN